MEKLSKLITTLPFQVRSVEVINGGDSFAYLCQSTSLTRLVFIALPISDMSSTH